MTLTCTEAPATCKGYFDDVEVANFPTAAVSPGSYRLNTSPILSIGRLWPTFNDLYMTVQIADISLWNPELTLAQIQEL